MTFSTLASAQQKKKKKKPAIDSASRSRAIYFIIILNKTLGLVCTV